MIKSLTSSEKRFLKLFSQLGTGRGLDRYEKLLEILLTEKEYKRERVRQAFGTDEKTLSVNQSRLYDYILKSLRLQKAGGSLASRLRQALEEIEILFRRGQGELAQKRLSKARKLARQFEQDHILLELIGWERKLFPNPDLETLDALDKAEQTCLERMKALRDMRNAHERMRALVRQENRGHSEQRKQAMERLLEWPAMTAHRSEIPFFAHVYHQNTYGLFFSSTAQWPKAVALYEALVNDYLARPEMIPIDPELFLGIQNNYLQASLFSVEHRHDFAQAAQKMRELKGLEAADQLKFQRIAYQQEFLLEMNFGSLAHAAELIPEMATWLQKNDRQLPIRRKLVFYYNFAQLYFVRDQYVKAHRWVNTILAAPGRTERTDIRYFAILFAAIIQFELGNVELQDSLLRSARRQLRLSDRLRNFEQAIIRFIQSVSQTVPGDKSPYQKLQTDLEELLEQKGDRPPLGAEVLLLWSRGKIKGTGTETQFYLHNQTAT